MSTLTATSGTLKVDVADNYDTLIGKVIATLTAEYDASRLTGDTYARVLAQAIPAVLQASLQTATQEHLIDEQEELLVAQKELAQEQKTQLIASVTYNNKIKALDSYGDMIGTMGAGSLVISTDMWTTLFEMINDLNSSASMPTSTTVSKL